MKKKRVLFICVHNTARSQIAEALLKEMAGDRFEVMSAGFERGTAVNPLAVKVMREKGVDISGNRVKSIDDLQAKGELFDYAITVCDTPADRKCGVVFGVKKTFHWSFEDPEGFTGTDDGKFEQARLLRDKIKAGIEHWIGSL